MIHDFLFNSSFKNNYLISILLLPLILILVAIIDCDRIKNKMLNSLIKPGVFKHAVCRNGVYPKSNIARFMVPDHLVFWNIEYPEYAPQFYTAPGINGQVWADLDIVESAFKPQWNQLDGNVNRVSFTKEYEIENGYPMNPIGRTGLRGRGLLGRWGPNHAADPIVTRWKRKNNMNSGEIVRHSKSNRQILQVIVIQRHDNKMWALPGGMVDPGEKVSSTLKREFTEEALNSAENQNMIDEFFSDGTEIYKGYVDDFRNTDNAWIETTAYNFHDDTGSRIGKFHLEAGDDFFNYGK